MKQILRLTRLVFDRSKRAPLAQDDNSRLKILCKLSRSTGFSLVELLVVITLLGFLVFLIASLPGSIRLISRSHNLSTAREIASKEIEDKRAIQYLNLANGEVAVNDHRIGLLPAGSGITSVADCDPQVCTKGENTKVVTVTVNWMESGKQQQVVMKTLISEGGLNK